ncbi:MAG TPA: dihydrofolate reductase family protein [Acidimicrobiia bacterium]|jgi:dihydrofolate reductase|nr:dihydrofolate reductase family protein [Acidimicrobiia bacterium]
MRRITTFTHVSLDGVMQAPAAPEEDTRGGFTHGGWAAQFGDEVLAGHVSQGMSDEDGGFLFGRRTYEHMASFWPHQTDGNPFTAVLNKKMKYVASNTLHDPEWQNTTVLSGDVIDDIAKLKSDGDDDLLILGSGALIRSLFPHGLIDEFTLVINPIVVGSGLRLFGADGAFSKMILVESKPTTTGALIAVYRPVS